MSNMSTDKPGSTFGKATAPTPPVKSAAKPKAKTTAAKAPKPADTAPQPVAAPLDDDARVFQQGRTASFGGISQDDAPYDKSDPNHAVWLKGHKSVA